MWCCCSQAFSEHAAVHRHVARTHSAEIQQLTQAEYERVFGLLEEEPEAQQVKKDEVETVDVSAWIPDISHLSDEQLQRCSQSGFSCHIVAYCNF